MIRQTDLFGEPLDPKIGKKNGKEDYDCCEACYMAKNKKCTCRCGGAFHGLGNHQHMNDGGAQSTIKTLKPTEQEEAVLTLGDYELKCPNICPDCGGWLGPIEHYDHSGGWVVAGFEKKQWLYKTCQKCMYQWALWKLGVLREQETSANVERNRTNKKRRIR